MFNIVLIDDEKYFLDSLAESFDWNSLGFTLTGTFTSSKKALEFIRNNSVDIIISDIKMPLLSGMDLLKAVSAEYPHIQIILLSAHADFSYAQEAIKYNVIDYVIKPFKYKKLAATLQKAYATLSESLRERISSFSQNIDYKAQKMIVDFMAGKISKDACIKLFNESGLSVSNDVPIAVVKLEFEDFEQYLKSTWKYGAERLYSAVTKFINTDKIYVLPINYSFDVIKLCVISNADYVNEFFGELICLRHSLHDGCFKYLNLRLNIEIEHFAPGIEHLPYTESQYILYAKEQATLILSALKDGNEEKALHLLENFICRIAKNDIAFIKSAAKFILLDLVNTQNAGNLTELPCSFETLHTLQDLPELVDYTSRIIKTYSDFISKSIPIYDIIERSREFIDKHYAENITLNDVANNVHVSPAYFSRIFKKATDENYSHYLNRIRISKAKDLLNTTTYKIYEISSMVGYNSYPYFLKIFTQYAGMPPNEYKKR